MRDRRFRSNFHHFPAGRAGPAPLARARKEDKKGTKDRGGITFRRFFRLLREETLHFTLRSTFIGLPSIPARYLVASLPNLSISVLLRHGFRSTRHFSTRSPRRTEVTTPNSLRSGTIPRATAARAHLSTRKECIDHARTESLWSVEKRPTSPPSERETSPPYHHETHPPFFARIVRSESSTAEKILNTSYSSSNITWIYVEIS